MKFILPGLLQEAVDLRSSELEESYQRTREFVMKYAVQKRRQAKAFDLMDTSEMESI